LQTKNPRMDKNLQNIEDLFKKGLEGNEESPSEEVWNAIDQSLEKANSLKFRKKYYLLKRATAILVVMLALLSIYVLKNESKKQIERNKKIENVAASEPIQKNNATSKSQNSSENKTGIKVPDENQSSTTEIINSKKETVTKNTNQQPLKNPIESLKSETANVSNAATIDNAQKASVKTIQKTNDIAENSSENKQVLTNFEENKETGFQPQNQFTTSLPLIFVPQEILSFNYTKKIKNAITILPYINPQRIRNNQTTIHIPGPPRFYATLFYSPSIPFSHLRDEDQRYGNPYSRELERNETGAYSYSFGVLVDYRLNNEWSLESGASFSTIKMNLEPEKIYAERDNQGTVKYQINTSLGKGYVLPSFSNNPRIGDSLSTQKIDHSLQYTGIPLAVKYHFNRSKLSINLMAGVSANILSNGKISTEVKRGNESELEKTHDIRGLKPLYFSGLAGIGFGYNIYRNFSLTFSPTINVAIDPINKNVPVSSYPGTVNFQFGLKTSF
jgi:hypothetical protein